MLDAVICPVGKFWTKLSKNPGGSFKKYLVGNLAGFFWTNSQLTHWAKWEWVDYKLSTNSQFACQVRPPLPPVKTRAQTTRGNDKDNGNDKDGWWDEGRTAWIIIIQDASKIGLYLRKGAQTATENKGYRIQSTETKKTCETNILV